ncbi:hypothetical protein K505DRAFT_240990 [Melanomma pulvis-pyrius CBS 109.77]|uniref:PLAC8-domain-containing protein n=1 Tax=Melanomma pulvis-pyrius CBS 109.77 TaxID=1314802 RepID=A0A6A6XFP6_9PLEO|nr:hypothetical protein K505DRAFT_240990 [Melanomma pulvis-pyrius CBS 109.77]
MASSIPPDGLRPWASSLWGCFAGTHGSLLTLACCCPCITYGETQYRYAHYGDREGYSCCHSGAVSTWSFCIAGLVPCGPNLLTCLQLSQVRTGYHIQGNVWKDCAQGVVCTYCSLVRAEREVEVTDGGTITSEQYTSGEAMKMAPVVGSQPQQKSKS